MIIVSRTVGSSTRSTFLLGLLLLLIFGAFSLGWAVLIPFDDASDEWAHYYFNVRHMLTNGDLPISGVDDTQAYLAGRLNSFGLTSARYSYTVYPPLNYIIAAVCAKAVNYFFGFPLEYGARLVSVLSGLCFCLFLYASLLLLIKNALRAFFIALTFACIPQVLFISSYLNSDAYSLAISALLCFATLRLFSLSTGRVQEGASFSATRLSTIVLFALSVALLCTAKYNYYSYFPVLALLTFFFRDRLTREDFVRIVLVCSLCLLLFAGVFFVRNFYLYGDMLGQRFVASQMQLVQERLGTERSLSLGSFVELLRRGFFFDTFKTSFALFGYLSLQLAQDSYAIFYAICLLSLASFLFLFFQRASREQLRYFLMLGFLFLICFALYLYNTLVWDFQAQGRYLFPLLVPIALFFAYVSDRDSRLFFPGLGFATGVLMLLLESNALIVKTYAEVAPTVMSGFSSAQADLVPADENLRGYEDAKNASPLVLSPEHVIRQPFYSDQSGLTALVVYVADGSPLTRNLHSIRLIDSDSGEELRRAYVFPFEFRANGVVTFVFKRVKDSKNRHFLLELHTEAGFGLNLSLLKTIEVNSEKISSFTVFQLPQMVELASEQKRALAFNLIFEN